MSLLELAERATRADGVAPFNEASVFALRDGARARVLVQHSDPSGSIIGAAYAVGDAPVELVVDPERRRTGIGRRILDELVADGEESFWAHGDLPGAQALAAAAGLEVARELLVLRLVLDAPPARERDLDGIVIRTYRPDDADAIVRVNARAFAHHPEQGAMDRADLDRRMASDWFDPEGLFVAERTSTGSAHSTSTGSAHSTSTGSAGEGSGSEIVGFHWTKVEDSVGEVYVVGIDPDAQGGGLGTALTARGLRHMYEQGISVVDLYVEGDNAPALKVYRNLGFQDHKKDVLYSVAATAAAGHHHP